MNQEKEASERYISSQRAIMDDFFVGGLTKRTSTSTSFLWNIFGFLLEEPKIDYPKCGRSSCLCELQYHGYVEPTMTSTGEEN